jgi:hypothetical protein
VGEFFDDDDQAIVRTIRTGHWSRTPDAVAPRGAVARPRVVEKQVVVSLLQSGYHVVTVSGETFP